VSDVDLIGALGALEREALAAVADATDVRALEAVRVSYLGRRSWARCPRTRARLSARKPIA
jgi:hypothetical protein